MKILSLVCASVFCLTQAVHSQGNADTSAATIEKVEQEANFPGGDAAWKNFLSRNLNAAVPVKNGAPIGRYTIIVQFVVNRDGAVSEIKPLTRLGFGMEEEVVRILQKSGSWEPARQNGRMVKAYRKQPVTFLVTQDGFEVSALSIQAGIDDEISIRADKVKDEDLVVSLSRGTIKPLGGGRFTIHAAGKGRVLLHVYNGKKNNKEIATVSLELMD